MASPLLAPAEMAKIAALAASPETLAQLSESEAGTLEWVLEHAKEMYQDCMLFSVFPDEGKYARKHYPKHVAFMAAGKYAKERGFVSANRTGKTLTLCFESASHIIGEYPSWWEGREFDEPVDWVVSGLTNESTRDVLTPYLLGKVKQNLRGRNYVDGTGMIPAGAFVPGSLVFRGGAGRIVAEIQVRYKDSKTEFSTLYMKSNEQGFGSFSGTARHGILLDEEHDEDVASECLTRTATTKGIMMVSFTPLSGITSTVMRYLPEFREVEEMEERVWDRETDSFDRVGEYAEIKSAPITREADGYGQWIAQNRYTMRVGWHDNPPHLTDEEKAAQIEGTPAYLLDAKTKGIPALGKGRVYPINLDRLKVRPFRIPDHWPRAYGMDVGWNWTAVLWGAWNEDSDVWYIYREYREGQAPPIVHARAVKARDDWIPGVIDPTAAGAGKQKDGLGLLEEYRSHGLNVTEADNSVAAGISRCYDMMTSGQLRFWPELAQFEGEFALYRYKEKPKGSAEPGYGKPVKHNDHLMDALRYLMMSGPMVAKNKIRAYQERNSVGGWMGSAAALSVGDRVAGY